MEIGPCAFEMVQVPAGSFKMGTDLTGIGWIEKNGLRPVHPVTIARPFLMQKTPVTVAQFRAFADATGYLTEAEHGVGAKVWMGTGPFVYKDKVYWRNAGFEHELWNGDDWVYRDDLSSALGGAVSV